MLENQLNREPYDLETAQPAGFWIRALAYLIDFLILLVLVVATAFVKSTALYLLLLVPMVLYKPVLEGTLGGTAGKLAIGLRVVNPEGGLIGLVVGFVRSAIFILPVIPQALMKVKMIDQGVSSFDPQAMKAFQQSNELLNYANLGLSLVVIASCVVVAFTARKRGLHDMVADTYVIRLQKGNA